LQEEVAEQLPRACLSLGQKKHRRHPA
jgi:hypothetical protein